jgi:hypothetical protein
MGMFLHTKATCLLLVVVSIWWCSSVGHGHHCRKCQWLLSLSEMLDVPLLWLLMHVQIYFILLMWQLNSFSVLEIKEILWLCEKEDAYCWRNRFDPQATPTQVCTVFQVVCLYNQIRHFWINIQCIILPLGSTPLVVTSDDAEATMKTSYRKMACSAESLKLRRKLRLEPETVHTASASWAYKRHSDSRGGGISLKAREENVGFILVGLQMGRPL